MCVCVEGGIYTQEWRLDTWKLGGLGFNLCARGNGGGRGALPPHWGVEGERCVGWATKLISASEKRGRDNRSVSVCGGWGSHLLGHLGADAER